LRLLQTSGSGTGKYIDSAIICSKVLSPVSFSVSREHYPVYMKDSLYNSNPTFDAGLFEILKTKLV